MRRITCITQHNQTLAVPTLVSKAIRAPVPETIEAVNVAGLVIKATVTYWLHTYRNAGDGQPLYAATCGVDTFI
ncbi:hypothetical protein [Paenibacillus sp. MMO-58]|uniref:hypothetical protein n=1 Tax=Paenibacillus sp. MMO-58 TaxID=3081290 RepID=UPI00301A6112